MCWEEQTNRSSTREKVFVEENKIQMKKMDSQLDFFAATQPSPNGHGKRISASLPAILYKWVILFHWNVKEKEGRFKLFERNLFPEIKDVWIECQLKGSSRYKKLKKMSDENEVFSLFAKVENGKCFLFWPIQKMNKNKVFKLPEKKFGRVHIAYIVYIPRTNTCVRPDETFCIFNNPTFFSGTEQNRIDEIIDNLNLQFNLMITSKKSVNDAYIEMIKTNPYALLKNYSYEMTPTPLLSGKEYDPAHVNETDSSEDEKREKPGPRADEREPEEFSEHDEDDESDEEIRDHLIQFPKHSQFLLKFRNAKIAADRSKKKTVLNWR